MPQNFLDCDREEASLMPPSLRDWLPEDHLAWSLMVEASGARRSCRRVDHSRGAVLGLFSTGVSTTEIGDECGIFRDTFETHTSASAIRQWDLTGPPAGAGDVRQRERLIGASSSSP